MQKLLWLAAIAAGMLLGHSTGMIAAGALLGHSVSNPKARPMGPASAPPPCTIYHNPAC